MNENCRRIRSPPHEGHARAVSTEAVIGRRSSNRCSHAMQRYSYAAIGRRIPGCRRARIGSVVEGVELPEPTRCRDDLHAQGLNLLGTLALNAEDDLADFVVLREPSTFEGPG
jgi:hypothetical protein